LRGTSAGIKGIDDIAGLRCLLKFRRPFYERAADLKIDTSKLEIEGVVEEIMASLLATTGKE
jgi:hypothetical protein